MQTIEEHKKVIQNLNSRLVPGQAPGYELLLAYFSEANYIKEDHKDRQQVIMLQVNRFCLEWCDRLWKYVNDEYYNLYWKCVKFEAKYKFESFLLYMEKNRAPEKKFYEPRKKTLKVVVDDLQALEDGKYKFYGLSMPPRVGKSTICIFFLAWIMGRHPDSHNAMGGHSGSLADGFYKEVINLIETDEYTYAEIFPDIIRHNRIIQERSAERLTINLGKADRFATLTCRGIDGTWTGAIDVSPDGYLYVDDLVRDRTHSLSPRRMEETYQEYLNKMCDRMNDGAKQLMVGTLWSVQDPLSRIERENKDDKRYHFRKIPALDPRTDHSNFAYSVCGFSTESYKYMRKKLDNAEWMAKYQQAPYVREGLLFGEDELRYFNGILPEGDYKTVAIVDVAWGGGDNLSMPVGREYENGDIYIFDWIYNNKTKDVTVPKVVSAIIGNEIRQCRFEGNVGGNMYSAEVDKKLGEVGYKCSCTERKAPNKMSKQEKIISYSDDIKRRCVFLAPNYEIEKAAEGSQENEVLRHKRSPEYQRAMEDLNMYTSIGKNEKDDAPDSLAQLMMFVEVNVTNGKVSAVLNPFWG